MVAQTQESVPVHPPSHPGSEMAEVGVGLCYACKKCSGGCPFSFTADMPIHQIVRAAQMGQPDPALRSQMIWLCTGCKMCYERCPNEIDGGRLNDILKILSLKQGIEPADPKVVAFNRSFLQTVGWFGRAYEVGLMMMFKLRTGTYLDDMPLGMKMLAQGKLKLLPAPIKARREIKEIFRAAKERQS